MNTLNNNNKLPPMPQNPNLNNLNIPSTNLPPPPPPLAEAINAKASERFNTPLYLDSIPLAMRRRANYYMERGKYQELFDFINNPDEEIQEEEKKIEEETQKRRFCGKAQTLGLNPHDYDDLKCFYKRSLKCEKPRNHFRHLVNGSDIADKDLIIRVLSKYLPTTNGNDSNDDDFVSPNFF